MYSSVVRERFVTYNILLIAKVRLFRDSSEKECQDFIGSQQPMPSVDTQSTHEITQALSMAQKHKQITFGEAWKKSKSSGKSYMLCHVSCEINIPNSRMNFPFTF